MSPGAGMSTSSRAPKTKPPNTRRIGWRSSRRCIASPGWRSGKPQSHAGARRTASEARRWIADGGQRGGRDDEQEHEKAVVGAAALRDRRDREPGDLRLHRHRGADETAHRPAPSASMNRPGKTPAIRQSDANATIAASEKRSTSLARSAAVGRAARPRKVMPNALARSTRRRAPPISASSAPTAGTSSFSAH